MATNIEIDKVLIEEAMKAGGHTTKRAVVIEALQEYIQKRNQLDIIEMFGTVPYDKDYDYKKSGTVDESHRWHLRLVARP